MQQLLARQSLSTEAATAPGQASSGELPLAGAIAHVSQNY